MESIVEQVREGLVDKMRGIQNALIYVRDARELERLQTDLKGAAAALAKLNEEDTRSPEELEKIANLINSEADVETTEIPWSSLSPKDKFKYHVELYLDKLKDTFEQVKQQYGNLAQVVKHLKKTKGDSVLFMNPVITQFEGSLVELEFSVKSIKSQLSESEMVLELVDDEAFFDNLELLNRFLNNPMNLPHLSEERERQIKELRNDKK